MRHVAKLTTSTHIATGTLDRKKKSSKELVDEVPQTKMATGNESINSARTSKRKESRGGSV